MVNLFWGVGLRCHPKLIAHDADEVVVREGAVGKHESWDERHTARVPHLFFKFSLGALLWTLTSHYSAADGAPATGSHDVLGTPCETYSALLRAYREDAGCGVAFARPVLVTLPNVNDLVGSLGAFLTEQRLVISA